MPGFQKPMGVHMKELWLFKWMDGWPAVHIAI